MALDDSRRAMREWAADLEAMRPFLDTTEGPIVQQAWKVALAGFKVACENYVKDRNALLNVAVETRPPSPQPHPPKDVRGGGAGGA